MLLQSLTEKQAKELRELKEGRNVLHNLNNRFEPFCHLKKNFGDKYDDQSLTLCSIICFLLSRDRQIKEIQASFEACKSQPVHATKKHLKPVEVLPLLPYFDRYDYSCFVDYVYAVLYYQISLDENYPF